jgi:hypothetical protein
VTCEQSFAQRNVEARKFPPGPGGMAVPKRKYCEATQAGTDGWAKPASPIGRSNKEMVVLTPTKNFAWNVSTTPSAPRGCFATFLDVAATPPDQEGKFPALMRLVGPQSLSIYSSGTSSADISRVRTSPWSGSGAPSTPLTMLAS